MEFPAGLHQVDEVLALLDIVTHCSVVVVPLRVGDGAVLVLVAEALQELSEDLVEAHLAGDDLGVVRAVEDLSDVVGRHIAVALLVDLAPSLVDPGLAGSVGLPSDGLQEGVEINKAVLLSVEVVQEDLSLTLGNANAVVADAEVELLLVELAHTVMNQDVLECLSQASQRSHAPGVQVLLYFPNDCNYKELIKSLRLTVDGVREVLSGVHF